MFCSCFLCFCISLFFFFFNDTATTEIYTLSLHDALPIWSFMRLVGLPISIRSTLLPVMSPSKTRSEEHTSELQLLAYLVCRLLLEKKKKNDKEFISKKKKKKNIKRKKIKK